MQIAKTFITGAAFNLLAIAMPAHATLLKLDVTVTSAGNEFSAPIFTFANLSSPGVEVNTVSILGGAPWDFVYVGPGGSPYEILNPAAEREPF